MEIILDEEEVAIDAIPLTVKSPRIVDWKIHKEGKKSYYQIIRVDGKSQMYRIFSQMLKSFDREDLEDLYKLVKARYGSTRLVESMDYLLWNDMKIMFEPHVEDEIYMLVEKKYPLTPPKLSMMLEKKLQIDYESEMAYQLFNAAEGVNDASEEVSTTELVSITELDSKLGGRTWEKTITKDQEHPEKCGETMTRAIIRAMVNKLPEEWFSGVSEDKDDLEGIIDYLEPTLYDGFIDPDDEAYKQRRNKLLGMPYTEPPPILQEEAEITRYNLGAGEVFTKTKILNIKEFPRTTPNTTDIRAEIINRNASSEDLSNTKRRH
ncbi:hypothetical protein Tco_0857664 [Tanacetum coccineum]|uniref:Uncharacterized protein n=1 Tax=Tanacetum coccineum TaxID=301880 RepID=A0ABQ5B937_9ASTR